MNILFLTVGNAETFEKYGVEARGVYTDVLRKLRNEGHSVYVCYPGERRYGEKTQLRESNGVVLLRVKTGNLTKSGIIEKGISTLTIEQRYRDAIKKYFRDVKFDIVLYSTPPITFVNVIRYVKNRDNAFCYLLLKDIFPQNAVDLNMLSENGIKGLIYRFFRAKEKALYEVSDKIGCMSEANRTYLLDKNPELEAGKIEVSPNSTDITEEEPETKHADNGVITFLYGGNLGRPQSIPFLVECLKSRMDHEDEKYLIIGSGTEERVLDSFIERYRPSNIEHIKELPRKEYEEIVSSCDAGLIFLDSRFTIPNFPSRLLSYLQAGLPVITCTDDVTDIGRIAEKEGFGFSSSSSDTASFGEAVERLKRADRAEMGRAARRYLKENCSVQKTYDLIISAYKLSKQ